VEAEAVEGLDGVVGHLLQPDGPGAPVLVAQAQDEAAVVGGGDDLLAVQVAGQCLGGLHGHVARRPRIGRHVGAGLGERGDDDGHDRAAQREPGAGREHVVGGADAAEAGGGGADKGQRHGQASRWANGEGVHRSRSA